MPSLSSLTLKLETNRPITSNYRFTTSKQQISLSLSLSPRFTALRTSLYIQESIKKMSENRDIAADVYDEGNPKLRDLFDLEAQQQQEETEIAIEGIASSSTNPTERAMDDAPSSIPQGHCSDAITASESGDIRSLESLLIPVEQAIDHFPPQAIRQENYEEKISISDPLNVHFSMKLRYDNSESVFVLENVGEWLPGLIQLQSLKPMDVIRFYRPVKPLFKNHYLIDYVKRSQQVARYPEFMRENYLFQAKITADSTNVGSLVISKKTVRTHFPAVGIPAETHGTERLYFTDAYKKEWIGEITVSGGKNPSYMLTFGAAFVSAYLLEVKDAIRFYRPVQPLNSRHFLIEILRRSVARADLSQSGSAEIDGDGDDSGQGSDSGDDGMRGGDNRQSGGQGGSRKGKRFSWKYLCGMKKGYQTRAIMAMQLGSSSDMIKEEEEKIVIKGI